MLNLHKKRNTYYAMMLIIILFMPVLQSVFHFTSERTLYGYTDPIPEKPNHYIAGFFDKSLQQWLEKKWTARLGFRAELIRSFNEINFRLFHETDTSRLKLLTSKEHGLYSNLSVDSLNQDVMYKKKLELEYESEAKQLRTIQNKLAAEGKFFVVVIASSKAYIYPKSLGKRFISGGYQHIFKRAANFGAILKAHGVHVIDSGPFLRHLVHTQNIETHPASGLHWNYYAACLITDQILIAAQHVFPHLAHVDCGPPQRVTPPLNDVDTDGYALLNVWSDVGVLKLTTYPDIKALPRTKTPWQPNIVFIGDSFSDQIRFVLKKANIYSHMVMSSYFKRRDVENKDGMIESSEIDKPFESQLLTDIKNSDIVVLEMVDYNVSRKLYGFADYFLQHTEKTV